MPRARFGAALCALAVCSGTAAFAQTIPAPRPTATTLPEIGRTRAKGFCSTVRENVAPSLLGLMKTDDLIGAGHRGVLKMAHDQGSSPEAVELDRVYLGKVVVSMAHNLGVIKHLLADEKRFPKTAASDDDRYALLLKAQLQAAAERQNDALNHLNGILENEMMLAMRKDIASGMQASVGQAGNGSSGAGGFLDSSALPGSGALSLGGTAAIPPSNTIGHTIWDRLAADIEVQQGRVAAAEQRLTPTIIAAAAGCQGDASPAPGASP